MSLEHGLNVCGHAQAWTFVYGRRLLELRLEQSAGAKIWRYLSPTSQQFFTMKSSKLIFLKRYRSNTSESCLIFRFTIVNIFWHLFYPYLHIFFLLLNHLKILKHFIPKYFSMYLLRARTFSYTGLLYGVLYATAKKFEFCPSETCRQRRNIIRCGI